MIFGKNKEGQCVEHLLTNCVREFEDDLARRFLYFRGPSYIVDKGEGQVGEA